MYSFLFDLFLFYAIEIIHWLVLYHQLNITKPRINLNKIYDVKFEDFSVLFAIEKNQWLLELYHQLNITEPRINLIYDLKFEEKHMLRKELYGSKWLNAVLMF